MFVSVATYGFCEKMNAWNERKGLTTNFLGRYQSLLCQFILTILQNGNNMMINHTRMERFKRGEKMNTLLNE